MPLRSHNILALLTQIVADIVREKPIDESPAFQQLVATETPWHDVFQHIDSISDFAKRHALRNIELDYTVAHARLMMQQVLPRAANDVWALERTSYLTGLFSHPFNSWDEYCAALDALEADVRDELEKRSLTPRRVRARLGDLELMRQIIGAVNFVLFEKNALVGEEGALNNVLAHAPQLVLCERIPGIPLSLAILYLITGARLGFPLYGVNTPGRFLLKWQYDDLEIFIDVFDKGSLVTRHSLEMLINANIVGASTRLLDSAPFEIITRRSLANLIALALRNEDNDRARKLEGLSRSLFGF